MTTQIASGTRLGPYEIVSPIGAGGMGEVWRARDTRLDRMVAIKVLPRDFAQNADLKLRLEREAKAISQLNDPHICTLHDVGHDDGIDFLVMELIDGETLADRLSKGSLPIEQVLRYGAEIAGALEKAHKAGVVHRDLKPGNIMITRSGTKLLDFGLAKSGAITTTSDALTAVTPLTAEGMIVGTFQYMAPEQIEGRESDPRSDIFAFGAVLYEMTTGKRAFDGKSRTSVIAAIVAGDPLPLSQLQPLAPTSLEQVIVKCLAKSPDDRWQCAADLKWELQKIHGEAARPPSRSTHRRSSWLPWTIAAVATLCGILFAMVSVHRTGNARPVRFIVGPPAGWTFAMNNHLGPVAVSPDGQYIAFAARDDLSGGVRVWVRDLAATQASSLPGTEGAGFVFWSPDSRSIGFFAGGYLKRVELSGGAPQTLCAATLGRGGTWSQNNEIVFAPSPNGCLYRVSASGGVARQLTHLNAARGELTHRWPYFLPDGNHFLFLVRGRSSAERKGDSICIASVDSPEPRLLLNDSSNVAYTEPGFLLYLRNQTLLAQRFNLRTLQLEGIPEPVTREPMQYHPAGFGLFDCSRNGVLAYASGTRLSTLQWLDRNGHLEGAISTDADYSTPRLSHDGQQILYGLPDSTSGNQDQWLFEIQRRVARRVTFDPSDDFASAITPDGKRLIFSSNRSGAPNIFIKPLDSPDETLLLGGTTASVIQSISPDGSTILFRAVGLSTQSDIYSMPVAGGKPTPLVTSPFNEIESAFSPTGHWVAYSSDESGRYEVYATRYPGSGSHIQISTAGGKQPTWRGDERELFYVAPGDHLMAVPIAEVAGVLNPGEATHVADVPLRPARDEEREYDVTSDGKRFVVNVLPRERRSLPITVILNWQSELAPAAK